MILFEIIFYFYIITVHAFLTVIFYQPNQTSLTDPVQRQGLLFLANYIVTPYRKIDVGKVKKIDEEKAKAAHFFNVSSNIVRNSRAET